MLAIGKWATVIGLSMTPALVLGQSAAAAAGIAWGLNPWILVPVIAVAGFVEGLFVAWLGGTTTRIGFVHRWCERARTPKRLAFVEKWGRWGAMTIGVACVGQEPMLLALRFAGVDLRKLIVPTAVSNAVMALIYYGVVKLGLDHLDLLKI